MSFLPTSVLDPLGHHAASCRHGGDVVTRPNRLRYAVLLPISAV